ncbi:MAG: DUF47 domain-containing protein [Promethearchaeia archaeon]
MKFLEKMRAIFKKEEPELLESYKKYLEELKCGIDALHEGFKVLLKGKKDKEKWNEVINCEHKCDRLKESYIETLFKTKRTLPFLIEDRYKMIQYLEEISDKTEEIAHFILLLPYDIYDDIKEDMEELNELSYNIVYELIDMVEMMEDDFNHAYQKTFDIEEMKRDARTLHYQLLEKLFTKREDVLRVYLISKLIVWTFDIISRVEEISDYLRGLIIKYPNK